MPGQYANNSAVTGTPVDDAVTADPANPTPATDIDGNPIDDVEDGDPSHYYGAATPAIDIEKDTNGTQADADSGPLLQPGDPVTWTFEVENTGNIDLANVVVTDTVTTDNGTVAGTVVCDWASSSDAATPAGNLSVGETVTCTSTSTAAPGQYANDSAVTGTPVVDAATADPVNPTPATDIDGNPLDDVEDGDPSAYYGEATPAIDIEKDTNGNQADVEADQDAISAGAQVNWTFEVENIGNVDLANVIVIDTVTTDNGTTPGAITCDWDASSDPATPAGNLSVGETVTCGSTSTAELGQYANNSAVTGTPVDDAVTADPVNPTPMVDSNGAPVDDVEDEDPSHYFGEAGPAIIIEKDTNGNQADFVTDQDSISPGDSVTWTFEVQNTGDIDLANVIVTDVVTTDNGTVAGAVVCDWAASSDPATPAGNLSIGETLTCTSNSTAELGQYANNSAVTGTPVDDAVTADPTNPTPATDINGEPIEDPTDEDPSHYFGETAPAIDIEKDTNGNQADVIADQDHIATGDSVRWTFEVENTGNVDLANVIVTDVVTTDNGTVAGTVVCDWASSSNAATPAGNLSVDETVTCTSTSTAMPGQYANNSAVTGTPVDDAVTADPTNPTPATDINGDPFGNVTDEDPSHYFGAALDLALRKQLKDGSNFAEVQVGDLVTFTITVFNQGNVSASNIDVIDYLPAGLELADSDWIAGPTGATFSFGNLVLEPGRSATVDITTKVTAAATGTIENNAEITAVLGVTATGEEILVNVGNSVLGPLQDIDSTPDARNTEEAIDDAIDNAGNDEDDHDKTELLVKASASTTPLAYTGQNTWHVVLLGLLLMLAGSLIVFGSGRRNRGRHKRA